MSVTFSGRFASKKNVVAPEKKPAEPPLAATVEDSLSEGPLRLFNHLLHYTVLCILLLLPLHVTRIRQIKKLAETFLFFSETIYKIESVVASPFQSISSSLKPILLTLDQQPSPTFDPPDLDACLFGCSFDDEVGSQPPTKASPSPSSHSSRSSPSAFTPFPTTITTSFSPPYPPHPIPQIIINPPEESDSDSDSDSFSLLSLDFDDIEEDLGSSWTPSMHQHTPSPNPSPTTVADKTSASSPEGRGVEREREVTEEREEEVGEEEQEEAERRVEHRATKEGKKGRLLGRWRNGLFRGREKEKLRTI